MARGYDQPYPAAAQAYKIFEKGRKSDAMLFIAGTNDSVIARLIGARRSVEPASQ
jgi:hypothetical protein